MPVVAQWDDHETHNNWYPGQVLTDDRYTEKRVDVLAPGPDRPGRSTSRSHRPRRGRGRSGFAQARIYRKIERGAHLDVFCLDMRTVKSPNTAGTEHRAHPHPRREQADWLVREVRRSRATWKVISADLPLGLVVPDGAHQEYRPTRDPGAPLGRELEIARVLRGLKGASATSSGSPPTCTTARPTTTAPSARGLHRLRPVLGVRRRADQRRHLRTQRARRDLRPEVVFSKAADYPNQSPRGGNQFFGHVAIDRPGAHRQPAQHRGHGAVEPEDGAAVGDPDPPTRLDNKVQQITRVCSMGMSLTSTHTSGDCPPESMEEGRLSRRTVLKAASVGAGASAVLPATSYAAWAADPATDVPILKPLPEPWFISYGTNAEMTWDSVDHRRYLTPQPRLFVRNHTKTPTIDQHSYRLSIFGDGLRRERDRSEAVELSLRDLRRLRVTRTTTVHECTGNGRSFYGTQQGTPASGTQWKLGSVGAVTWEGVRLADVLHRLGISRDAVDVMATGLDPSYVDKGVDYGQVRRPLPISKVLDDALLAWGATGGGCCPTTGFRCACRPGLGRHRQHQVARLARGLPLALTSPWNTKWYRMTGGDWPDDSPPLTVIPVRSAWELADGEALPRRRGRVLHGRFLERSRSDPRGRGQRGRRPLATRQAARARPGVEPMVLRVAGPCSGTTSFEPAPPTSTAGPSPT